MFQWRENSDFWAFAEDPQKRQFITCLVEKDEKNPAKLENYLHLKKDALRAICRPKPSSLVSAIPGSGIYLAATKVWSGAPLETEDYLDAGFDTIVLLSSFVPVAAPVLKKLGLFGKLIRPGRGVLLPLLNRVVVKNINSALQTIPKQTSFPLKTF